MYRFRTELIGTPADVDAMLKLFTEYKFSQLQPMGGLLPDTDAGHKVSFTRTVDIVEDGRATGGAILIYGLPVKAGEWHQRLVETCKAWRVDCKVKCEINPSKPPEPADAEKLADLSYRLQSLIDRACRIKNKAKGKQRRRMDSHIDRLVGISVDLDTMAHPSTKETVDGEQR